MILYPGSQAYDRREDGLPPVMCQNMYPERIPMELGSDWVLVSSHGLGFLAGVDGIARGMFSNYGVFEGDIFSVFGGALYRTNEAGVTTLIPGPFITGADRVIFTSVRGGHVVFSADGKAYDFTGAAYTQIASPNLPAAVGSVASMDGRVVYMEEGSDRIYWSEIFAPGTVLGTSFATAETNEDELVRVIADHRELWLFGQQTIEIWRPTGNADGAFARAGDLVLEKGTLSPWSVTKLDNTVFWVGQDAIVYRAEGAGFRRVSNHGIEQDLQKLSLADLSEVYGFSYTDDGHIFYILTIPGVRTYCYDASTQAWTTRKTQGFETWLPVDYADAFSRNYTITNNTINLLTRNAVDDTFAAGPPGPGGATLTTVVPIERIVTANIPSHKPVPVARLALTVSALDVVGDVVTEAEDAEGAAIVNPQQSYVYFSFSDDAGRTSNIDDLVWSNEEQIPIHYHGQYNQRLQIFRQGQVRSPGRTYRMRMIDSHKWLLGPMFLNDAAH